MCVCDGKGLSRPEWSRSGAVGVGVPGGARHRGGRGPMAGLDCAGDATTRVKENVGRGGAEERLMVM